MSPGQDGGTHIPQFTSYHLYFMSVGDAKRWRKLLRRTDWSEDCRHGSVHPWRRPMWINSTSVPSVVAVVPASCCWRHDSFPRATFSFVDEKEPQDSKQKGVKSQHKLSKHLANCDSGPQLGMNNRHILDAASIAHLSELSAPGGLMGKCLDSCGALTKPPKIFHLARHSSFFDLAGCGVNTNHLLNVTERHCRV